MTEMSFPDKSNGNENTEESVKDIDFSANPEVVRTVIEGERLTSQRAFSRLQSPEVTPYDLVIFDEAHKLSASLLPDYTVHRTDRYRLAEALAGAQSTESRWVLNWSARHLLLLTATPHMGKISPYFYL